MAKNKRPSKHAILNGVEGVSLEYEIYLTDFDGSTDRAIAVGRKLSRMFKNNISGVDRGIPRIKTHSEPYRLGSVKTKRTLMAVLSFIAKMNFSFATEISLSFPPHYNEKHMNRILDSLSDGEKEAMEMEDERERMIFRHFRERKGLNIIRESPGGPLKAWWPEVDEIIRDTWGEDIHSVTSTINRKIKYIVCTEIGYQYCSRISAPNVLYRAFSLGILSEEEYEKEKTRLFGRTPIKAKLRDNLVNQDNSTCQACGSGNNLQVDHIVPMALGGDNDPDNLQALCRDCNNKKFITIINFVDICMLDGHNKADLL